MERNQDSYVIIMRLAILDNVGLVSMAMKSGEERLKEMEAEMALFEQEVLGGQVAMTTGDPVGMEVFPMGVPMAVPMIRPIIGTNTYRRVQQTLDARAATFVGPPPPAFVGPAVTPGVRPPPMMRPAFMPHILQRPGPRMPVMRGLPPQGMMAPPLPRPPPPPPMMMAPPMQGPPQHPQHPMDPMGHMSSVGLPVGSTHGTPMGHSMVSAPSRSVTQAPPKLTPSIISAAPTVYTAPSGPKIPDIHAQRKARMEELAASVAEQQAAVMAAGLLEAKKEASLAASDDNVIGPSMPEPEPVHSEPADSTAEEKKKGKQEKAKKCIRTAAGTSWEDQSLLEWDSDDFRIFCGDLGNEVNDDILARAFSRYPSYLKAKVVRDKRTGKTKGYGFVSFKDPNDYVRAMREMNGDKCTAKGYSFVCFKDPNDYIRTMREMNGRYVGSRPIKLRKSMWKDRNMEVVRKKQKEKKKLGLR